MTVAPATRGAGRPRKPPLSERAIAMAALEIIDAEGWSACTMRAIAARLGVRAPSLYHHIDGQSGIVDLVRSIIVGEMRGDSISRLPWDEGLRTFAVNYYRAFVKHPNTIPVLITAPVRDAATLHLYEVFLQMMTGAGWSGPRAIEALLGVEHLALGFALERSANDSLLDAEQCRRLGAPLLAELVAEHITEQGLVTEAAFLHLLEDYIEALRMDRAAARRDLGPRRP